MSELKPAEKTPCGACPWRVSNQGKPHPHNFYSLANLKRLWIGMRRGERMTCHPTDPRMADWPGYEGTARQACTRECAGSLVLVQREMMRYQDACEIANRAGARDGLKRYKAEHPRGLTREGVICVVGRALAHLPGELYLTRVNLNEPGIGAPGVREWEPRTK